MRLRVLRIYRFPLSLLSPLSTLHTAHSLTHTLSFLCAQYRWGFADDAGLEQARQAFQAAAAAGEAAQGAYFDGLCCEAQQKYGEAARLYQLAVAATEAAVAKGGAGDSSAALLGPALTRLALLRMRGLGADGGAAAGAAPGSSDAVAVAAAPPPAGEADDAASLFARALPLLRAATQSAEAQFLLGECLRQGYGAAPDEARARAAYQSSALLGHAVGMYTLATRCLASAPEDSAAQHRWMHAAAELQHPGALHWCRLHPVSALI